MSRWRYDPNGRYRFGEPSDIGAQLSELMAKLIVAQFSELMAKLIVAQFSELIANAIVKSQDALTTIAERWLLVNSILELPKRFNEGTQMLNPKKWSIFCWGALLLWGLISVAGNVPFEPEFSDLDQMNSKSGTHSYEFIQMIGCPFSYLEISKTPNKPPVKTFIAWKIFANLILVPATLFGIIYSFQVFLPRFSILTMLIMISCIGLLLTIGRFVFSLQNFYFHIGFIYAIYFAPLFASVVAYIVARNSTDTEEVIDNG